MSEDHEETFSVCQFFPDGSYDYIKRYVTAEDAMTTAKSYIGRPAAVIGVIRRLIVEDGGGCIVFEWQFNKGITFPLTDITRQWNEIQGYPFNETKEC